MDAATPDRLRVLITNLALGRHGTGVVTRDIALGLSRRGHFPVVYSPSPGELADEISARGIPTITRLSQLGEPPDVIHGHHYTTAAEAFILYPGTPGIFFCHGWDSWLEAPVRFPQLLYAAVSETTRDRLVQIEGIAANRVSILPNAVDLRRIPQRSAPLPERPRRALVFGNLPYPDPTLTAACSEAGLELAGLGGGSGKVVPRPEEELTEYDLVFATGRSAIEAICCGAAVVLCDENGLGPMVTAADCPRLRKLNFALRALDRPFTKANVLAEVRRYDAEDAARAAAQLRSDADLETYLDELESLYRRAIAVCRANPPSEEDWRAAAGDFLNHVLPGPAREGSVHWEWQHEKTALLAELRDHREFRRSRSRLFRAWLRQFAGKAGRRQRPAGKP